MGGVQRWFQLTVRSSPRLFWPRDSPSPPASWLLANGRSGMLSSWVRNAPRDRTCGTRDVWELKIPVKDYTRHWVCRGSYPVSHGFHCGLEVLCGAWVEAVTIYQAEGPGCVEDGLLTPLVHSKGVILSSLSVRNGVRLLADILASSTPILR